MLAKRQFATMHYSCFCVNILFLHIVESAPSDPYPSGFIIYKSQNIKTIGQNQKNKKKQRGQGTNLRKAFKNSKNKKNKTFRPMSPKPDIGLKVLFVLLVAPAPLKPRVCPLLGNVVPVLRPPRTHVHFGRHRILHMSLRDEPGDCWA